MVYVWWFTYSCSLVSQPKLTVCHIIQHVPPSQSWAYWVVLLDGRCGHCPARSLHGWIRIHFCTASSHGWTMSGRPCAFGSESNHLHSSPYRRIPESIYHNVTDQIVPKGTQWKHAIHKAQIRIQILTFSSGVPRKSSLGSLYSPEIL